MRDRLHVEALDPQNRSQFGTLSAFLPSIRECGLCVVSENLISGDLLTNDHPFSPNNEILTIRLGDAIRLGPSMAIWIIAESNRGWSKLSSTYFTSHSFTQLETARFPGGEVRVYQPYAVSPALTASI